MNLTRNTQAYRARKRADGICIYGGCWTQSGGHQFCRMHADRDNERQRERKRAKKEAQR